MYNLELVRPGRRHFFNTSTLFDKEFDKLFETINRREEFYTPACEIRDEEKEYHISLDIPGMKKDEINLEVKDNQLHITGERKVEKTIEKDNVLRSEKRYGKFSRVFTLPQNVNADMIEASFEDGVLYISVPKEEKNQARKITISGWKDGQKTTQTELNN